jgi:ADP-ribosylglycohydrolase
MIEMAVSGRDVFDVAEYKNYEMFFTDTLKKAVNDFFGAHINLKPEDYVQVYLDNIRASNTLFYALYCVKNSESIEEVISNVISFNGDADSVNALAMMIWGLTLGEKLAVANIGRYKKKCHERN